MEETWFKKNFKKIMIVLVGVILIAAVFLIRYHYVTVPDKTLLCICDALSAIGLLYLLWGAVLFAISKGGADGLAYFFSLSKNKFRRKQQLSEDSKYGNYYDFSGGRPRRPNNAKLFAVFGGIALLISLILLIFYYRRAG